MCPSTVDELYEDDCSSDGSVDIDLEYLNFSKKTLEHQEQIGELIKISEYFDYIQENTMF